VQWGKSFLYSKKVQYDSIIAENNFAQFEPIIQKLIEDGIDEDYVREVYSNYRLQMQDTLINMNIHYQEKREHYAHNLESWAIAGGKVFMHSWLDVFKEAEELYHVDKEIIVAILWVETKCGQILGNHLVLNVYTTLSMLTQPEQLEIIKQKVKLNYPEQDFNLLIPRIERKSSWGYRELLNTFTIGYERDYIDILELRGSWAGAFGFCQFLPSSYLRSAVDGDGNGQINLFNVVDAVHSVANYLHKSGFSTSLESRKKAIRSYNNSTFYVETVLEYADKIKEMKEFY